MSDTDEEQIWVSKPEGNPAAFEIADTHASTHDSFADIPDDGSMADA